MTELIDRSASRPNETTSSSDILHSLLVKDSRSVRGVWGPFQENPDWVEERWMLRDGAVELAEVGRGEV